MNQPATTPVAPQGRLSFGLKAMLLVYLDAHCGQWLTVEELAEHGQVSATQVRRHLEDLSASGMVKVQRVRADGVDQGEISEAVAALGDHVYI